MSKTHMKRYGALVSICGTVKMKDHQEGRITCGLCLRIIKGAGLK